MCPQQCFTSVDLLYDVIGRFCPDERVGVLVVVLDVLLDRGFKFGDTAEAASTDALVGNIGKPAFDEVKPGRGGGNEVKVEAWVLGQPIANFLLLMRRVVIDDTMQGKGWGGWYGQ